MRRFLYFLFLAGGIGATVFFLLFNAHFIVPGLTGSETTLFVYLKDVVFQSVRAGSWAWADINVMTIFTYGLVAFLFISGVLLLSLLVMALTTFFNFKKVYRFFATVWWYLIAAILFTGSIAYLAIDLMSSGVQIMTVLKELPWQFYMPIVSAIVLVILRSIFKERRD